MISESRARRLLDYRAQQTTRLILYCARVKRRVGWLMSSLTVEHVSGLQLLSHCHFAGLVSFSNLADVGATRTNFVMCHRVWKNTQDYDCVTCLTPFFFFFLNQFKTSLMRMFLKKGATTPSCIPPPLFFLILIKRHSSMHGDNNDDVDLACFFPYCRLFLSSPSLSLSNMIFFSSLHFCHGVPWSLSTNK